MGINAGYARLVELAQPGKHVDAELAIGVQQVHQHPVLADQPVLEPPEIEAAHRDPLARRCDPHPAVMGDGLDHVGPAGDPDIVARRRRSDR